MTPTTDNSATVELKLATTGVVWLANLEAQGADHLRVRVREDGLGVIPILTPGTALECTMRSEDGRYYVTGSVLDQRGPLVWLSLPAMWRKDERREFARQSGGFAVKYGSEEAIGIAHCVDISAGGIRIRVKQAMTVRTHVDMLFTLPGEALPVRVRGLILHCVPAEPVENGFELGIKFVDLQLGDATRIARYSGG